MFSKRGLDPMGVAYRRGAIAFRLTLWYALLSVVLVASAGSILYWVLADCLRRDDDQWLAGQIAQTRHMLALYGAEPAALRDKIHRETVMLPGSYLRVLDAQGRQLGEAVGKNGNGTAPLFSDASFAHDLPEEGVDWTSAAGEIYRLMFARPALGEGFTIQVAIDRTAEEQVLKSYQRILLIVLSGSLAIAVLAGYLIARRSLQPVARLAAIIDQLSAAHLYRRIADEDWPTELRPLAANFDQLLGRLDASFARISRFSADIAHELRTPLHILRGEAELALSKARSNEDYRDCIISATEEYDRLARMVDELLLLARMESPDSLPAKHTLNLQQEIASVCDFYQALADEQETSLTLSGSATVQGDAALLRRALGNLIVNALRHTHRGGRIHISVRPGGAGSVDIVVRDTGEGISEHDMPYVFDRFYRADNARSAQGTGTGLGLAIVKSIMQLHGGSVSLSSQSGSGTTATLSFPGPHPAV